MPKLGRVGGKGSRERNHKKNRIAGFGLWNWIESTRGPTNVQK